MPVIKNYRDLLVWQKSMDLCVESYRLCDPFPRPEEFGLKSQIRRAASSIPANIAEGHGRDHLGDYLHHLSIAKGSLAELETHLLLAARLGYLDEAAVAAALRSTDEISRMLNGLSGKLRSGLLKPKA
jgi:four helix bundle protein